MKKENPYFDKKWNIVYWLKGVLTLMNLFNCDNHAPETERFVNALEHGPSDKPIPSHHCHGCKW